MTLTEEACATRVIPNYENRHEQNKYQLAGPDLSRRPKNVPGQYDVAVWKLLVNVKTCAISEAYLLCVVAP